MNDRTGLRFGCTNTDVMPEFVEVHHVLAQILNRDALRRSPQDVTALRVGFDQPDDRRFQTLALSLIVNARRYTDPFTPRHVHKIARGQGNKSSEPRALRAHRVFDDLHENIVARVDEPANILRRRQVHGCEIDDGVIGRRVRDVRCVQERGALETDVDKRSLHSGQHPRHSPFVDITDETAAAGALDVDLLQHIALDDRGPGFSRSHVDQDLDRHGGGTFQQGIPAPRKSSAVSKSGKPMTPE